MWICTCCEVCGGQRTTPVLVVTCCLAGDEESCFLAWSTGWAGPGAVRDCPGCASLLPVGTLGCQTPALCAQFFCIVGHPVLVSVRVRVTLAQQTLLPCDYLPGLYVFNFSKYTSFCYYNRHLQYTCKKKSVILFHYFMTFRPWLVDLVLWGQAAYGGR